VHSWLILTAKVSDISRKFSQEYNLHLFPTSRRLAGTEGFADKNIRAFVANFLLQSFAEKNIRAFVAYFNRNVSQIENKHRRCEHYVALYAAKAECGGMRRNGYNQKKIPWDGLLNIGHS